MRALNCHGHRVFRTVGQKASSGTSQARARPMTLATYVTCAKNAATSNRPGNADARGCAVGLMSGYTAGNRFDCFRRAVRSRHVQAWTTVLLRQWTCGVWGWRCSGGLICPGVTLRGFSLSKCIRRKNHECRCGRQDSYSHGSLHRNASTLHQDVPSPRKVNPPAFRVGGRPTKNVRGSLGISAMQHDQRIALTETRVRRSPADAPSG
jgi:hypothetical protein